MNVINAVVFGVVEGITEFLPISSTAHLIFASKFLRIPQTEFQKFFEVFIQSGAILAVVLLYWRYLLTKIQITQKVIISFLPTAFVGFVLYKVVKNIFFQSNSLILFVFIGIGLLFLLIESLVKNKRLILEKTIDSLTVKDAVMIGLAQSLAVVPGVSRAGIVIIAMILMRYRRDQAALYSFLLAVPTILAASALDFYQMRKVIFSDQGNLLYLFIAFIVSFVTAYLAIKWLINYLQKNSLKVFGIYRIALGFLLFIFGF